MRAWLTVRQTPLLPSIVEVQDRKGRIRTVAVPAWDGFGASVWALDGSPWPMQPLSLKRDFYEDCLEAKGYRLEADEQ